MKISFTKLPDKKGNIEVSFNGGKSYIKYDIDSIREDGIPLDDSQDYSQIQIKGTAGILKDLEVLRNISVEGSLSVRDTDKPIYESVYRCYKCEEWYIWTDMALEEVKHNFSLDFYVDPANQSTLPKSITELEHITPEDYKNLALPFSHSMDSVGIKYTSVSIEKDIIRIYLLDDTELYFSRYPSGDIYGNIIDYESENVTQIIENELFSWQTPRLPFRTTITAPEGKAFKKISIDISDMSVVAQ